MLNYVQITQSNAALENFQLRLGHFVIVYIVIDSESDAKREGNDPTNPPIMTAPALCDSEPDPTAADQIVHLTRSCLYPEQSNDIGTDAPDDAATAAFRRHLGQRLHQLCDTLHLTADVDQLPVETRAHLILLYCEQTAKFAAFRTDEPMLQQTIDTWRLHHIDRWLQADNDDRLALNTAVLAWHKERVTVARWRRQPGAVQGLARYACVCYPAVSARLPLDDALFLLAAGSLAMEHFEHTYKELALDMFVVVLRNLNASDLHSTNLADPIYQLALQQVPQLKDLHLNRLLWQCLRLCLRHKTSQELQPSRWNCRDDVGAALLTRLAFEGDATVREFLVQCIPAVFAPEVFETMFDPEQPDADVDIAALRAQCSAAGCCLAACRWTKKLAAILSYHCSCCFGPATDVAHSLRIVHAAYLSTVHRIPVALCAPAVRSLCDELPTHLLQLWRHGERDARIGDEVRSILESVREQISAADVLTGMSEDWQRFFGGRAETLTVLLETLKG